MDGRLTRQSGNRSDFQRFEGSIRETRSPQVCRTADSFENCGMGGNYVEVDLTRQHLWMYVDYRLVLQTDFVSGDLAKNHATPSGIYTLYYKESPAVLKVIVPGDSQRNTGDLLGCLFNGGIGFRRCGMEESRRSDLQKQRFLRLYQYAA